uniref:3',5'-cyclic AMP phosphodiesterase CpdA n=1 Tax=Candidatus Kentrum sp. FW TaxID=2126338 RepID=A0A450TX22_9GAMM|nr:MAG: 3',5'-cyclic AMP phosphodiesterase CpdA [Candidatus Kentron sp. FW]
MLLLHISDIHFRTPNCTTPDLDPERPFRTHLLRDARNRINTLGSVGAILVTGDIAYKGAPEEYDAAFHWLKDLSEACQCPLERVYVVPGNHDVDRSTTREPAVRKAQHAIQAAESRHREQALRDRFGDPDASHALLKPLTAYNDFAGRFSCQVYPPERLYWKQEIELDNGVALRIHGLTSTLLSGTDGDDDTRCSLYLSPLQTVLDPVGNVVNLVMCHHPPDWFLDYDDVDEAICSRAAIHLFGHNHRQRIMDPTDYIRFSAGAVNPDRHEPGWEPGYNLIDVKIAGDGADRNLEINAHVLRWQSNPDQFVPKRTRKGEEVFRHRIPISDHSYARQAIGDADVPAITGNSEPIHDGPIHNNDGLDVEAAMSNASTRKLVFRFWELRVSQRREIARKLELITEDELSLPGSESERYGRALMRAAERGLLDQVAGEIEKREKNSG